MIDSSQSKSRKGRTSLVIISHTSSHTPEMTAELEEQLKYLRAFCRGLDKKEYKATLYDFEKDRQTYTKLPVIGKKAYQKRSGEFPLFFIDEELVWSGTYPTNDELADLLKIGCRDLDNCSDCCWLSSCRILKS